MQTLIGFIIGAVICTPFGFLLGAVMARSGQEDRLRQEWLEKEYFDVQTGKDGFEVMTH